ncbi:nacht and wd domain-containing [Trichoderma arundinaceum]|uniref:Nacht and wd domain-containing n=1 Tax=Trichoderma arundinaceum TaxID=490622 RepID=A0A395NU91_TRIAR|nr:nacht and wd domain-containing [Trichoderma arundinaceum]
MSPFPAAIKTLHARVAHANTDTSDGESQETDPLGLRTLYDPTPRSAAADIIFIHGLGGNSRKTWSNSSYPRSFWPQDWLPVERGFEDVRVHTFGYRADWGKKWQQQSILNIHDFAESLIGGLRNNPNIRRDDTRIILVGHSMGGCVAKEAYIIARQHPSYQDLAGRIYGIFFLGTPHHGSDLAGTLENMLIAAWGKKPFVTDLKSGSSALALIRDRFRHVATDLALWTFYETLPTALGPMSRIVVEKDSAILGFDKERIEAMNADHRHVCKFTSREDSNYIMLRNALHTAIDEIKENLLESDFSRLDTSDDTDTEIGLRLKSFLGVRDTLEDDLALQTDLKIPDSCEWLTNKSCFASWKAGDAPTILWLTGRPATGKSILSSHVINHLKPLRVCCSYFFFKHSATNKSTLSDCFRSLAFQMASQDNLVGEKLIQLEHEGIAWDKTDDATIWTKLFVDRIFKLALEKQHFWVIDGLDECANFNSLFTKKLLAKLPRNHGFRVFITSRNLDAIERGIASLGPQVNAYALSDSDTLDDIRLFLTTKLRELDRLETENDLEAMCNRILEKSSGSFLWARLVLQEFENAWTEEAMEAILREVPGELGDLYSRMVQSIEMDKSKTGLAKTILTWVVLARRPLALDELRCAVKLDLNQTLQNMRRAIPSLCGQLVYVDPTDKAHIIHETAREFLLGQNMGSQLTVHKEIGHTHIASILTRFLSGDCLRVLQMKSQRSAKLSAFTKSSSVVPPDSSLLDYASTFFSEHIYRCSSSDDDLMDKLCAFLNGNVLSWIEHVAKSGDLSHITRAAMNLRGYVGRRAKYVPPTDMSVSIVEGWVTDLIRVAAKFQSQLLTSPRSIHRLVPPLCPSDSMIYRTFSRDLRSATFVVKGLPVGTWDDCLSRIDYQKGQATAVSHGDTFFAVGLSTGKIFLYNVGSVQLKLTMIHPERVKILQFSQDDEYMASCSAKSMVLWNPRSGTQIHKFSLPSPPLGITFLGVDEVLCAFQSGRLTRWSLERLQHDSIPGQIDDDYSHTQSIIPQQAPVCVAFLVTPDIVLLAVGYRKHPVLIWNTLEQQVLGQCFVDANNGIDDMVFNPNPDIIALVVSCNDGRLCLFDYSTMALTFTMPNVYAQSVACSPDGHSLVTGGSHGMIEVFDFDHDYDGNTILMPIYRIDGLYDSIRSVAFSFNGLRFLDVHGQQCRVWEPTALVRKNSELESTSDAATLPVTTVGMPNRPEEPEITSPLETSEDGRCVVAGTRRGDVSLFSTTDGAEIGTLIKHARGVSIVGVAIGEESNLVVSADESGRVLVGELAKPLRNIAAQPRGQKLPATRIVLDRRFGASVVRMLINRAGDRILITGHTTDELWELPSGKVFVRTHQEPIEDTTMASCSVGCGQETTASARTAFQHPTNSTWFVIVTGNIARVFRWADYGELTSPEGIHLQRPAPPTEPTSPGEPTRSPKVERFAPPLVESKCTFATTSYHVGAGHVVELLQSSAFALPKLNVNISGVRPPSPNINAQRHFFALRSMRAGE